MIILCVLSHTDVPVGYHISEGERSFTFGTLPDLVFCLSPFIACPFVFFCYNKAVILSIVLSSKLSVLRGRLWGISIFIASLSEVMAALGTSKLVADD